MLNKIVGGTIAWNQGYEGTGTNSTGGGVTYTNNHNGSWTLKNNGTATNRKLIQNVSIAKGHVIMLRHGASIDGDGKFNVCLSRSGANLLESYKARGNLFKTSYTYNQFSIRTFNGFTPPSEGLVLKPQWFDLTAMFGSTIADYAYTLESGTAGGGVAWLKSYGFFSQDYYPYHATTLESVNASAHVMRDSADNIIGNYALDPTVHLRGILKLDANNKLYYDGDEYASDGTVMRKYAIVTYNGTEDWKAYGGVGRFYIGGVSNWKSPATSVIANIICDKLTTVKKTALGSSTNYVISGSDPNTAQIIIQADNTYTTVDQIKSWLSSNNITVVYALTTPITETADPFTKLQDVSKDGTEQFVDAGERDIEMPVQHETVYPVARIDEFAYDSFPMSVEEFGQTQYPMSVEESGQTQYPMEVTSQNIIVG